MEFSKELVSLGIFWVGTLVILMFALIGVIVMMDKAHRGEFVKAPDSLDRTFETIPKD